jgi:hypothetical protein
MRKAIPGKRNNTTTSTNGLLTPVHSDLAFVASKQVLDDKIILEPSYMFGSWGSSESIVTDYGLDDRGPIPDRGRGFFF